MRKILVVLGVIVFFVLVVYVIKIIIEYVFIEGDIVIV